MLIGQYKILWQITPKPIYSLAIVFLDKKIDLHSLEDLKLYSSSYIIANQKEVGECIQVPGLSREVSGITGV